VLNGHEYVSGIGNVILEFWMCDVPCDLVGDECHDFGGWVVGCDYLCYMGEYCTVCCENVGETVQSCSVSRVAVYMIHDCEDDVVSALN
jgi:hypothetical protein